MGSAGSRGVQPELGLTEKRLGHFSLDPTMVRLVMAVLEFQVGFEPRRG